MGLFWFILAILLAIAGIYFIWNEADKRLAANEVAVLGALKLKGELTESEIMDTTGLKPQAMRAALQNLMDTGSVFCVKDNPRGGPLRDHYFLDPEVAIPKRWQRYVEDQKH